MLPARAFSQAVLESIGQQTGAIGDAELLVNRGQMVAQRAFADVQFAGDDLAGFAGIVGDEGNDFVFAFGQLDQLVGSDVSLAGWVSGAREFDEDPAGGFAVEPDLTDVHLFQGGQQCFRRQVAIKYAASALHDGLVLQGAVGVAGQQQNFCVRMFAQACQQRQRPFLQTIDIEQDDIRRRFSEFADCILVVSGAADEFAA